jgi:phosphatidylserine decarboxylase
LIEQQGNGMQYSSWIKTDEDDDVVVVMGSSSSGRSPRCYIQSGERVGQGQRCGYARFGAKLTLYIPVNSRVEVKPGDNIHAGSDILAKLVHKE